MTGAYFNARVCPTSASMLQTLSPPCSSSSYLHVPPHYGTKMQYAETDEDIPPLLTKEKKRFIQQVAGMVLHYGQAVNPTTFVALSINSNQQTTPSKATLDKV